MSTASPTRDDAAALTVYEQSHGEAMTADREPWFSAIGVFPRDEALGTYAYLCCNCGVITPQREWTYWQRPDTDDWKEDEWRPSRPDEGDPMMRCPSCQWEHVDDDSNPGVYDGSLAELAYERERLLADPVFAELWTANSHPQSHGKP